MKQINILFFLLASIILNAQKDSQTFNRFFYVLKYQPKKSDTTKMKANFVLDIDGNRSVFRDYLTVSQDSLVSHGLKYLKQTGENNMEKLGVKESDFSFKILKTGTETITTDMVGFDSYQFPEPEKFNWQILPETKNLFGLRCQKAVTNAFGRNWTAWFTTEFPYKDGPYKFSGLPGLIVDIADETDSYHFSFMGNKNNLTKKNNLWDTLFAKNTIETTKNKFLKIEQDFRQNPYANYYQKIGNDPAQRKTLDDMRKSMIDYYSKFDNPLELPENYSKATESSTKIKIVNEEGKPVALAKVGFGDSEKGTFSDKNGEFVLPESLQKSEIKIVMPGYDELTVNGSEIKNSTIILHYKSTKIEEVVLRPKDYKMVTLGYKTKSKTMHIDYLSKYMTTMVKNYSEEELEKPSGEIAVPLNFDNTGKILKININFAKFELETDLPVRFIIYEDEDGKPGKMINEEDILFNMNKSFFADDTAVFDVSAYNLILKKGKYYLSFQPLSRDFQGRFFISAGILGSAYQRHSFEPWAKLSGSFVPGMNVTVKMEK